MNISNRLGNLSIVLDNRARTVNTLTSFGTMISGDVYILAGGGARMTFRGREWTQGVDNLSVWEWRHH